MKNTVVLITLLAAAQFVGRDDVAAEGALVIARDWGSTAWAFGMSVKSTPEQAEAEAWEDCQKTVRRGRLNGVCELKLRFKNECAAVAYGEDDEERRYKFGWSSGRDEEEATRWALSACSTDGRVSVPCKIEAIACDK